MSNRCERCSVEMGNSIHTLCGNCDDKVLVPVEIIGDQLLIELDGRTKVALVVDEKQLDVLIRALA